MSPATAPGLLFPGGLLVHVLLEHWLGGIMGFGMGIYPKLFTRIKKALGSKVKNNNTNSIIIPPIITSLTPFLIPKSYKLLLTSCE
jgi:hypothetical protein